jgi:N-acetylglucosamine repressor
MTVKLNAQEIEALKWIRRHDGISRKRLAEKMGLSQASITKLTRSLIDHGYIVEGEQVSNGMGRNEILLHMNPDKFRYLGLDIGAVRFRMAIADNHLRILHEDECLIRDFGDTANPLPQFLERVDRFLENCGVSPETLDAIGIGVTGIVDAERKRILNVPNIEKWESLDIVSVFDEHYQCPVYLEESGRVMAIAEKVMGQAKQIDDFIIVHMAYSIVAGVMINGQLLRGYNNAAGLLGHITVDESLGRCTCGNYGCLENQVTFPMIQSAYYERTGKTTIAEDCKQNDKAAIDICIASGKAVGVALSNTVNLFNPQMIFVGGPVFEQLPLIFEETKRTILLRANRFATVDLKLLPSSFGDKQGIVGALSLAATSLLA